MKNYYNLKVHGISMATNIVSNYRTTKGGKRILYDSPCYMMKLSVYIEPIDDLIIGSTYQSRGMLFRYNGNGVLISVETIHHDDFIINTLEGIDIFLVGGYKGEIAK